MPLTRSATDVREYKIPAFYEASTETQVKQIPRPVDKAHAIIGTPEDGRIYKFDANSSASDDGYAVLQPTDTNWTGRWLLSAFGGASEGASGGVYNVKSFGAEGDGTTDDSTAIQDAIDAATANNGGIVFFPTGAYSIETTLTLTEGIRMEGVASLDAESSDHGSSIINNTGSVGVDVSLPGAAISSSAVFINHLTFLEGGSGGTYAIQFAGAVNSGVADCSFDNHNNAAILFDGCTNMEINRVSITSSDADGLLFSNNNTGILIQNSYFQSGADGKAAIKYAGGVPKSFTVQNNFFTNNQGKSIWFDCGSGISALSIRIRDNVFTLGNLAGAADEDIYFERDTTTGYNGCLISGNRFESSLTNYAMRFEGLFDSTIRDNYVSSPAPISLDLDANSQDNLVEANSLAGTFNDNGTNNEFVDQSNEFIGLNTKDFVNDRTNARQPSNGVYFNGAAKLDCAKADVTDLTTENFTISTLVKVPESVSGTNTLASTRTLAEGFQQFIRASGAYGTQITDISANAASTADDGEDVRGRIVLLTSVIDRDADTLTRYIDGVVSTGAVLDTSAVVDDLSDLGTGGFHIGHRNSDFYLDGGEIFSCVLITRALSAAEVLTLHKRGNTPEIADQWGGVEITSGTLEVGQRYRITDFQAGDDFTNVGAGSNANGVEFLATGTTPATWTNSSGVTPIGAVVALLPENIESDGSIVDASSNELNATGTNTSALLVKPQVSGTFTPALVFSSVQGSQTYTSQSGRWRKLDEKTLAIWIRLEVATLDATESGNVTISGLPETAFNAGFNQQALAINVFNEVTPGAGFTAQVTPNNTTIDLYDPATAAVRITEAQIQVGTVLVISGVYEIE